jgi:hypothetical protein
MCVLGFCILYCITGRPAAHEINKSLGSPSAVARAYFYDELANQLEASVLHPSIVEWWVELYFSFSNVEFTVYYLITKWHLRDCLFSSQCWGTLGNISV